MKAGYYPGRDDKGKFRGGVDVIDYWPDMRNEYEGVNDLWNDDELPMPDLEPDPDQISNFFQERPARMNSIKRARYMSAPVAQGSSVNYKSVNRTLTLSGREYWRDVVASSAGVGNSAYAAVGKLMRPTDSGLFSWLAPIASKFEEFKFSNLTFVFESQVPSSTAGQVALWFDGDPTHAPPANWNNMINTGANVHGAVWTSHKLVVPRWLYSSRASYYTQAEFADANSANTIGVVPVDPLEYFPGIFGYSSEGCPPSAVLGKIYLEYTVSLKTQNVDGFNTTGTTGLTLSSELSAQSGNGYFHKLNIPIQNLDGGGWPIGATVVPHPATFAGSQYWKIVGAANAIKYWVAPQDFEVLITIRSTAAMNVTQSLQWAPPLTSGGGTPVFVAIPATNMQEIVDDEGAATDRTQQWMVRFLEGYYFRVQSNTAPLYWHMTVAPFTFQLQA